jgi:hypothetical protein
VFDTDLELENYNVAGAPYSGAVGRYAAMMQDRLHSAWQELISCSNLPR